MHKWLFTLGLLFALTPTVQAQNEQLNPQLNTSEASTDPCKLDPKKLDPKKCLRAIESAGPPILLVCRCFPPPEIRVWIAFDTRQLESYPPSLFFQIPFTSRSKLLGQGKAVLVLQDRVAFNTLKGGFTITNVYRKGDGLVMLVRVP